MLTLNEIRNVNFRKANFGGYRAEDVEAFIDEVQLSYDTLLRENAELVKKLEVLAAKLEDYQSEEDSIRNALMNAQKVGDASLRDAKHKAEIILKDATIKAEKIVSNAQSEIHRERDIIERMQRDVAEFKTKLLKAYKDHLTLINSLPTEEILRSETKEMVNSVQMLDRRAVAPSYDRPGQTAPSSNIKKQPVPQYTENFEDEAQAMDVIKQEAPSSRTEPPEPYTEPSAFQQPSGAMPIPEKPVQRSKGGFTVDINDAPSASLNMRAAPPMPAPSRRDGRFGAEPVAEPSVYNAPNGAVPSGQDFNDGADGVPASLFKRRK